MNIGDVIITIAGGSVWYSGPPGKTADEASEALKATGTIATSVSTWTQRDEIKLHAAVDARGICEVCRACQASAGQPAEARRGACCGGPKAKRRAVKKAVESALAAAGGSK